MAEGRAPGRDKKPRKLRAPKAGRPNRIEYHRVMAGLSREDLAERIGCFPSTVERLETGKMKLTQEWLAKFAGELRIAPGELLEEANFNLRLPAVQNVPLVEWHEIDRDPRMLDLATRESVPISSASRELRATRVITTAMNSVAPPGTIIIVDMEDTELVDQLRYLFRWQGRVEFRQYRSTMGVPRFEAESTDHHQTIYVPPEGIQVVGRAIHKQGDL